MPPFRRDNGRAEARIVVRGADSVLGRTDSVLTPADPVLRRAHLPHGGWGARRRSGVGRAFM